jgi:hypothetical protein
VTAVASAVYLDSLSVALARNHRSEGGLAECQDVEHLLLAQSLEKDESSREH